MRYIDSGLRDPRASVGAWLDSTLVGGAIAELRIQSGYVGPQPFGYLEPALRNLQGINGATSILLGSNEGQTRAETVENLLRLAGGHRSNLNIAVLYFGDGLFHPKVYHATRPDGSMTAYVGSANFTYAGISGKNIEAGVILDTADGDDGGVLAEIRDAIDAWFTLGRPGVFPIRSSADIIPLQVAGILSAPIPPRATRGRGTGSRRPASLLGLIRLPAITKSMLIPPRSPHVPNLAANLVTAPDFVDSWSKRISASDAQRKRYGNQSGVIALTQGNRRGQIDQTWYFRNTLFGGLVWQQHRTRTGNTMDVAELEMHTTILGRSLGVLTYEVNHDNLRESNQDNYTAKLSLAPIRDEFAATNMTGRTVEIGRDSNGSYWMEIA